MKLDQAKEIFQVTLKQRNFGYMLSFLLIFSNLGLTYYLMNREEKYILVPMYDINHRAEISNYEFSESYLVDWADSLIHMLFTANPESVDKRIKDVMILSTGSFGALKKDMDAWSEKIKKDRISTAFYPKSFDVFKQKNEVVVCGRLLSYYGTDRQPVVEEKQYLLTYEQAGRGVILLKSLKEIKK